MTVQRIRRIDECHCGASMGQEHARGCPMRFGIPDEMAPGTAYAVPEPRECAECRNALPAGSPGQRRLCNRCRDINNALKHLRAAQTYLDLAGLPGYVGDVEWCMSNVERSR